MQFAYRIYDYETTELTKLQTNYKILLSQNMFTYTFFTHDLVTSSTLSPTFYCLLAGVRSHTYETSTSSLAPTATSLENNNYNKTTINCHTNCNKLSAKKWHFVLKMEIS